MAYCLFHMGEYKKSLNIYVSLLKKYPKMKEIHIYKSICYYALCDFEEAKKEAQKGEKSALQNRLMY